MRVIWAFALPFCFYALFRLCFLSGFCAPFLCVLLLRFLRLSLPSFLVRLLRPSVSTSFLASVLLFLFLCFVSCFSASFSPPSELQFLCLLRLVVPSFICVLSSFSSFPPLWFFMCYCCDFFLSIFSDSIFGSHKKNVLPVHTNFGTIDHIFRLNQHEAFLKTRSCKF